MHTYAPPSRWSFFNLLAPGCWPDLGNSCGKAFDFPRQFRDRFLCCKIHKAGRPRGCLAQFDPSNWQGCLADPCSCEQHIWCGGTGSDSCAPFILIQRNPTGISGAPRTSPSVATRPFLLPKGATVSKVMAPHLLIRVTNHTLQFFLFGFVLSFLILLFFWVNKLLFSPHSQATPSSPQIRQGPARHYDLLMRVPNRIRVFPLRLFCHLPFLFCFGATANFCPNFSQVHPLFNVYPDFNLPCVRSLVTPSSPPIQQGPARHYGAYLQDEWALIRSLISTPAAFPRKKNTSFPSF